MSEALVYNIKPGKTTVSAISSRPLTSPCVHAERPALTMIVQVGNVEATVSAAIRLSGAQILEDHCFFTNENGVVSLTALPDSTTVSSVAFPSSRCPDNGPADLFSLPVSAQIVNGKRVPPGKPQMLKSGFRIILGDYHVFRFQNPMEVRLHREAVRSSMSVSISASDLAGITSGTGSPCKSRHEPLTPNLAGG